MERPDAGAAHATGSAALADYARSVYSQNGEDGIIERIFQIIGADDKWCVEFGAADGKKLSNTYNLVAHHDWSSVLIEADGSRYRRLRRSLAANPRVHSVHALVGYEGPNTLDKILETTPIPRSFSLLSIDVDGTDYFIWEALRTYRPRVVVIEFNPTIPVDIDFVQPRDPAVSQGNSLRALVRLGKEKGYELVAVTDCNGFFVEKELFAAFGIAENAPEKFYDGRANQTRLFQLFDGTIVLDGCDRLLWHDFKMTPRRIQILPRFARTYPGRMNRLVRLGWLARGMIARKFFRDR